MVLPSLRTFIWCPATVGKYSRLNDSFSFYLSAWKTSWPKSVMQWFAAVSYVCQNHSNRTKPFSHVPRHTKNPPHGMYINPSWECFPSTNAGGKKNIGFPKGWHKNCHKNFGQNWTWNFDKNDTMWLQRWESPESAGCFFFWSPELVLPSISYRPLIFCWEKLWNSVVRIFEVTSFFFGGGWILYIDLITTFWWF